MDDETRTAIAELSETVAAGFARMDRYFELQQGQFLEFRAEVKARLDVLTERVDRIEAEIAVLRQEVGSLRQEVYLLRQEVDSLRHEFRSFRDWATGEISDLRRELPAMRQSAHESQAAVRRDLDQLGHRVDRLEERVDDLGR